MNSYLVSFVRLLQSGGQSWGSSQLWVYPESRESHDVFV